MQRSLAPFIAGCVAVAALVFAAPGPASATTAVAPAVHYGETNAGIVQQVGHRHYRGHGYRHYGYRPYGYGYRRHGSGYRRYGYGYRPYGYGYRRYGYGYRPYGYGYRRYGYGYRPYGYGYGYRPYGYYGGGYGYPYWRRPGVSLWFGF
jgi:hypothetical protein